MKFNALSKFHICYSVHQPWAYLKPIYDCYVNNLNLQLCPDFKKGHIWTREQQIAYVEYVLKHPYAGAKAILFNHPGWMSDFKGDFILVDGLQRLTAAVAFLQNEIPACNTLFKDFEDGLPCSVEFIFNIANLKTNAEVLQWYTGLNSREEGKRKDDKIKCLCDYGYRGLSNSLYRYPVKGCPIHSVEDAVLKFPAPDGMMKCLCDYVFCDSIPHRHPIKECPVHCEQATED